MISSAQNTQVKNIIKLNQKAKVRREQGLFIAEGRKMFLEAPDDWIEKIYVAESMLEDEEVMKKVRRFSWDAVENGAFRQMCDTQTPQGILTVLRQPSYELEDLLKEEKPLLMVLEDLQDPGNAGTIIRTGEGAGVSGVFLTKTCVDITNPKVIRATMGSVYRIPFFYVEDVVSLKQKLQGRGIRFFAAHLQGKNSYDRESYEDGTAFLIGNEGKGLTDQAADAADCLIRIPMCGRWNPLMQLWRPEYSCMRRQGRGGDKMEPLMWLIVLAVFLVIEAITVGLTTIWFAGGALVAAIASGAGAGILVQWILFLVISLVLLIFTRPLAVRYMNKGVPKTNVNSLIGEKAVVIQKINNLEQTGQVRINDIEWMARTSSDEVTIPEQTVVTIEAVQGVKLIVKEEKEGK